VECLQGRPLRALPPYASLVFVCLVNDAQARGPLVPTVETITRLGLTVAFVIGLYGHGPMVCLELSGVHVQSFAHKKLARLSELLDYEFPSCHSEYACKLHKMSEVPSVIGAEYNGQVVTKNMRMTLVSPVAGGLATAHAAAPPSRRSVQGRPLPPHRRAAA
jgi:hypothetical protein